MKMLNFLKLITVVGFLIKLKNSENDLQNLIKDIFKNQKLISTSKKLRIYLVSYQI